MENHLLTLEDINADKDLKKAEQEELNSAHAMIFRHAQSEANAGGRTNYPAEIVLSKTGHLQAEYFANFLDYAPSIVYYSKHLRTAQTIGTIVNKFPKVRTKELPDLHEFTYLNPKNHVGTNANERRDYTRKYWKEVDPEYRDGGEAESFVDFWERVKQVREAIEKCQPGAFFASHGQVIKMLMFQMSGEYAESDKKTMIAFRKSEQSARIANTCRIAINSTMQLGKLKLSHLPEKLITY